MMGPLVSARVRWLTISMLCSAALAGVTAWWVTDWVLHRHADHHHAHDAAATVAATGPSDLHAWMHKHLDLTPEQHAAMEPGEEDFADERERLGKVITAASKELAKELGEGNARGPALTQALDKLHAAQGELQRATLDHFFAMKRYLRPAQVQKFREWTHDSLTRD